MDTCRVSAHRSPSLLWAGRGGEGVAGESQEATAWDRVGRPGWMGAEGPRSMGLALWLRVGVLLTVVPYLTSAHAHSCGVMPKADAAPC